MSSASAARHAVSKLVAVRTAASRSSSVVVVRSLHASAVTRGGMTPPLPAFRRSPLKESSVRIKTKQTQGESIHSIFEIINRIPSESFKELMNAVFLNFFYRSTLAQLYTHNIFYYMTHSFCSSPTITTPSGTTVLLRSWPWILTCRALVRRKRWGRGRRPLQCSLGCFK
jgi:hypothetical protein